MEVMDTVLRVSHAILMIGGAVCMILLFVWLCMLIIITRQLSWFVSDVRAKYEMIQSLVFLPVQLILQFVEKRISPTSSKKSTRKTQE